MGIDSDVLSCDSLATSGIRVAIILPAYNEELTIGQTIADFYACIPNAEFWVINNNSNDETESVAKKALQLLDAKGGVILESRQGKGNAVRRAFHDVDADIYVLVDADLTYPGEHVNLLVRPVLEGLADMVVGDRHSGGQYSQENKRPFHNFGNKLVQLLVNRLFGASLVDIMSGFRVFTRSFVKTYPIVVEGFEIETDMTLHALDKRFRILELPINYRDRPAGSLSKLNTFSDGLRVIWTIATILRHYRPLTFFGSLAIFCATLGFLSAIPVLDDWIRERYIYHIPLAILATGLEIVALMFGSIGLILDSIIYQERRQFESSLLRSGI